MNQKKYGGEDFGKTLEQLKAMAPHAVTLEGVRFEGAAHKVGAILGLAAVGGDLIAEIERLSADLAAARIDQEIAQFARDTSVIPGLAEALDPFMEALNEETSQDPATNEDWYAIMSKLLAAAKESGLWPVKPESELTEDAQADRDAFDAEDTSCRCHINPPCGHCTHPGNPVNQAEDPACWKVQP